MFVIFVIVVMVMEFVGEKNFIKKDYFLIYIFFYLKSIDILDSFWFKFNLFFCEICEVFVFG